MSKKSKTTPFVYVEHPNVNKYGWRLLAATTTTEAATLPSGKILPADSEVVVSCPVLYDDKTMLRFNMPSVCALLLDHANSLWPSCADAVELFTETTPDGIKAPGNDPALFELLERRMAIVVFSYSAVEAFANEVIAGAYGQSAYVYSLPNPKTGSPYTLADIERSMDLETKLCSVLPEITRTKNPKGTAVWQRFGHMRRIRHFIIHPKLPDRIQTTGQEPKLWKMLTDKAFRNFAHDAKALMMHYAAGGAYPARWLFKCPF